VRTGGRCCQLSVFCWRAARAASQTSAATPTLSAKCSATSPNLTAPTPALSSLPANKLSIILQARKSSSLTRRAPAYIPTLLQHYCKNYRRASYTSAAIPSPKPEMSVCFRKNMKSCTIRAIIFSRERRILNT